MKDKLLFIKENRRLIILVLSSILMLVNVCTGNHYLYAFGLTQYVIVIAIHVAIDLKGVSISEMVNYNDEQYNEAIKGHKPLAIFAYGSAIPAVIIGIEMILILTISVWFIRF